MLMGLAYQIQPSEAIFSVHSGQGDRAPVILCS